MSSGITGDFGGPLEASHQRKVCFVASLGQGCVDRAEHLLNRVTVAFGGHWSCKRWPGSFPGTLVGLVIQERLFGTVC